MDGDDGIARQVLIVKEHDPSRVDRQWVRQRLLAIERIYEDCITYVIGITPDQLDEQLVAIQGVPNAERQRAIRVQLYIDVQQPIQAYRYYCTCI